MGKNQHSKDLLHLRPTEWAEDGRGFKEKKWTPFSKLHLDCCYLSLQPFETPVGTREGHVFEVKNIVKYVKKFKKNPITGGRMEIKELIPLTFHRNESGKLHCPVTFKEMGNYSHVVCNMASGHVYGYEAVQELNLKNKMFKDLVTNEPFKKTDLVVLQDPDDPVPRQVSKFHFMREGQQQMVTEMLNPGMQENEENKARINVSDSMQRVFDRLKEQGEERAEERKQQALEDEREEAEEAERERVNPTSKRCWIDDVKTTGRVNERFTDGCTGEAFTSSVMPVRTQNDLRKLTEEEELLDIYEVVRKKKGKGYVRLVTNQGNINIELHCNIVPRTCDNFLRHCEREYYNGAVFHRLIQNFMMQGGDPTGTGRGGRSAFEGGRSFKDEFDSRLEHKGPGVVSMANNGQNTNKSQFFVTLKSCQHLDLKHSIFGRVVGGLPLLEMFNAWPADDDNRPIKEIKLLRTEVFKNPFADAAAEMAKPKVEEKVIDASAQWFSNRIDPMDRHPNRDSHSVGKYLMPDGPKRKKDDEALPDAEMEYVTAPHRTKKLRTDLDLSNF